MSNFTLNLTPTNGAQALANLIARLVASGWTVPMWSDGTTKFTTGTPTGASGAGGLANASAWFVVQQPTGGTGSYAGTRQLLFANQSSPTNSTTWLGYYSKAAGFTGGSASAVPTATDGVDTWFHIQNQNNDITLFPADGTAMVQQVYASSVAPFTFYSVCYPSGSLGASRTQTFTSIILDFSTAASSGSDADPAIVIMGYSPHNLTGFNIGGYGSYGPYLRAYAWLGGLWNAMGPANVLAQGTPSQRLVCNQQYPGSGPLQNSNVGFVPVIWLTSPGTKGISSLLHLFTSDEQSGFLLNQNSAGDNIVFGDFAFPWDGVTTPSY